MEVIIVENSEQVSDIVSQKISQLINRQKNTVLGLATGSTPIEIYQKLVSKYQQEKLSFSHVTSFNLDEYIGINAEHPQSYRSFMQKHLFDHVDIQTKNTHVPECDSNANFSVSAARYEAKIEQSGGIDLQLLGIGSNGHIGFNEPSSSLTSRTRVKTLASSTLEDNRRFFSENEFQPDLALTMGIANILDSKQVILVACGLNKANAIKAAIEGPLSAHCPASALQLHRNAIFVLDNDAASALDNRSYYQRVFEQKQRTIILEEGHE